MPILIPSSVMDVYTRLEVLLGLKVSDHTDTLTEASNFIDDLIREVKFRSNNNIELLLTNFLPNKWDHLVKY